VLQAHQDNGTAEAATLGATSLQIIAEKHPIQQVDEDETNETQ
jgi:hypothetical protein